MAVIDHLVYAVAELGPACDRIEASTGVRPALGGAHPGMGSHNALVSLGSSYLEVIAPDPDQPQPAGPRPFGIDELDLPALLTFAARPGPDETIDDLVVALRSVGQDPGEPMAMSRRTPDGVELHWRLTMPSGTADGVIPFLIDWGDTPNPATTAPGGLSIEALTWSTSDESARSVLDALGLDGASVDPASGRHTARLRGAAGAITL